MGRNNKSTSIILFLIGLFSMTQIRIIGSIGISEIPIYLVAPFLFLFDYGELRNDGFLPIIWLSLLTCVGDCVSSYINHTYFLHAIKGFATPYSIFAVTVVLHRLLRRNMSGYKSVLVGTAFSMVVNIFIFQQGTELSAFSDGATGIEAGRRIVGTSAIFWTGRIRLFIDAFVAGWYTQLPLFVSTAILFLFAVFSAVSTASGRSMAAITFGTVLVMLIGGKKKLRMKFFKRYFLFFLFGCVISSLILSVIYKSAAQSGLMGEKAREKYEVQMKDRSNVLGILKGGRGEVFIGVTACLDKPFLGHGPWPVDQNDYIKNYFAKYGTDAEWRGFFAYEQYLSSMGYTRYHIIPAHSHLVSFWLCYGIVGLFLWIYVLYLIVIYFKRYIDAVPQWFGYMALTLPAFMWNVFFSPYGGRVTTPLMICLLLFTRAIAMRRIQPSLDMVQEAAKYA